MLALGLVRDSRHVFIYILLISKSIDNSTAEELSIMV